MHRASASWVLESSKCGHSTTALGNLFHYLTDLMVKKLFLILGLHLLFHSMLFVSVSVFSHPSVLGLHQLNNLLVDSGRLLLDPLAPQSFILSGVKRPSFLSLPFWDQSCSPLTIVMALHWTLYSLSMPFSYCRALNGMEFSKRGLKNNM